MRSVTSVARGACVAVVPPSCPDAWVLVGEEGLSVTVAPGRWVARPRHTGHVSLGLPSKGGGPCAACTGAKSPGKP